jgi:hypothetical protein
MRFFEELKYILSAAFETGKQIWYFIVIANIGFAYFFLNKGYSDYTGLIVQVFFITVFIPLIITLRKEFGS